MQTLEKKESRGSKRGSKPGKRRFLSVRVGTGDGRTPTPGSSLRLLRTSRVVTTELILITRRVRPTHPILQDPVVPITYEPHPLRIVTSHEVFPSENGDSSPTPDPILVTGLPSSQALGGLTPRVASLDPIILAQVGPLQRGNTKC